MKRTKFLSFILLAAITAFTACTNVNDPEPEPTATLPLSETFETGIGSFTTQSVTGDQDWEYSSQYKYMSVSGYVSDTKLNNANEDWLISPEIDLSGVTAAKLTFDHVVRYFADIKNEATVWVSENYVSGLPATATWTQLKTATFVNAADWTLAPSGEISLTAYAGKKVKIAFKYVSTSTKAGTWEIKNFLVQEGEAAVIAADQELGSGTELDPYNVTKAITNQGAYKWVEGYIVGNVDGTGISLTTESKFVAPFTIATNVLIAASATETDYTKCMPVQLPAGAVRTGLNLLDNAGNLGKKVKLYGSLESYFGVAAIKTTSYYELEGGTTGGTKPVDTSDAILSETFASSLGAFTIQNVVGVEQLWAFSATYKCAVMSGYINSTKLYVANEDWLISPEVDLINTTTAKLTFDHVTAYFGDVTTETTVWVSENYSSGLPSTATWTPLTTPPFVNASNYTFGNSGEISLAAYAGKKIKIAFKYISSDTKAGTWEIKNLIIK